jgi:hypothetical protein
VVGEPAAGEPGGVPEADQRGSSSTWSSHALRESPASIGSQIA